MTNQVDDIIVDGRYTITHNGSGDLLITDTVTTDAVTIQEGILQETSSGYRYSQTIGIASGDELSIPIHCKANETVTINNWWISLTDSSTDTNVELEFVDMNGTVGSTKPIDSSIATNSSSPVDSDTAGGSPDIAFVNVLNNSGTEYISASEGGTGVLIEVSIEYTVS